MGLGRFFVVMSKLTKMTHSLIFNCTPLNVLKSNGKFINPLLNTVKG